jgi:hypothetical protein
MPAIYLTACQATQVAAEVLVPHLKSTNSDSKEFIQSKNDEPAFLNPANGFALLVGINKYGEPNNLRGCVNDVHLVKSTLINFGWNLNNIKVLLNEQATKANVIRELQWLAGHDKNSSLLLNFSGHGGWTLTPEGIGWECCICCVDCNDDWDNGVITRTQFQIALDNLEGNLQVTLDSCYSGGMVPSYPAHLVLPSEVHNLFDDLRARNQGFQDVRALPGPEWLTAASACKQIGQSLPELLNLIGRTYKVP